jgi:hypothetical protein
MIGKLMFYLSELQFHAEAHLFLQLLIIYYGQWQL